MSFAVAAALLFGFGSFPAKRLAESGWDEYEIGWVTFGFGVLPLCAATTWLSAWRFEPQFWPYCAVAVLGNMLAVTAYYRAIRMTDLSIVLPIVSISPAFMLVTTKVILGETTSSGGTFGVLIVVAGAYLLGCAKDRSSMLAPVAALAGDHGARWALLVAVTWSITSNVDKICLGMSNSVGYPAVFTTGMTLAYSALLYFRRRGAVKRSPTVAAIKEGPSVLYPLAVGVAYAAMLVAQFTALYFMAVPYVIAIKRSGLLVGVAVGALRGEKGLRWRVFGGVAVVAGIAIIALLG